MVYIVLVWMDKMGRVNGFLGEVILLVSKVLGWTRMRGSKVR